MMNSSDTVIIENVQITIPLGIITTLINDKGHKIPYSTEWTVKPTILADNEDNKSLKLSTQIDHDVLTLGFERLPLHAHNDLHTCRFSQQTLIGRSDRTDSTEFLSSVHNVDPEAQTPTESGVTQVHRLVRDKLIGVVSDEISLLKSEISSEKTRISDKQVDQVLTPVHDDGPEVDGLVRDIQVDAICHGVVARADPVCVDVGTQTECFDTQVKSDGCPGPSNTENSPIKRKRGRPRLNKAKILNEEIENKTNSEEQNETRKTNDDPDKLDKMEDFGELGKVLNDEDPQVSSKMEVELYNDISDKCTEPSKRYSLRGAKLNRNLMNAVKGLIDEEGNITTKQTEGSEENCVEMTEIDDGEEDTEFMEKSCDSDSDYETPKGKKIKMDPLKENLLQPSSNKTSGLTQKRKKRKGGVVACKICGKLLCDYTGVYNHVLRKHSRQKHIKDYLEELTKLKIVRCEICDIEVPDTFRLRVHTEIKHGDTAPAQCNQCGKSFKNILSLKGHIRTMHVQVQGKCNLCHLCSAAFKTLSNLKQHIQLVHVKKPDFVCKICNKTFGNKPQLTRHSRNHGLDESKRVHCSFCNKSFLFEFNLRRHINGVHAQRSEKFHCSYCGKGFQHKSGMITHVQGVHFNLFPFSCSECSVSFPRSALLRTHMISSHGKLDYQLPELLSRNGVYDRTSDNMFYCSYCSTGFTHKAKLVEHMHTDHASAFPHMCTVCNQGFLEKSFLDIHNLRVHNIVEDLDDGEGAKMTMVCGSGEILRFITTKEGCPSKIVAIQSEQSSSVTTEGDTESLVAQTLDTGTLLVEVAEGSTTTQYMVQAPEGMVNSDAVVQDISNILMAAGKTLQTEMNSNGVQEISFVIQTPGEDMGELTEANAGVVTEVIQTPGEDMGQLTEANAGVVTEVIQTPGEDMGELTEVNAGVVTENMTDQNNINEIHANQGDFEHGTNDEVVTEVTYTNNSNVQGDFIHVHGTNYEVITERTTGDSNNQGDFEHEIDDEVVTEVTNTNNSNAQGDFIHVHGTNYEVVTEIS